MRVEGEENGAVTANQSVTAFRSGGDGMAQVFVSYAEEDGHLVGELAAALEANGYSTWYYQRDCRVPGQRWWRRVLQAIDECEIVLLLISRPSLQSAQVDREVDWAIAAGKPLMPLLHGITRPEVVADSPGREWLAAIGTAVDMSTSEGVPVVQQKLATGLQANNITPVGVEAAAAAEPAVIEEAPPEVRTGLIVPGGCSWYQEPPEDCPVDDPLAYGEWVKRRGPVSIINEKSGLELVWVPGGSFMMGSVRGRDDEKPVQRKKVEGFWIGRLPVTVRQWQLVMGSVPPRFNDQGAQHPVVGVTWDEAREFCRRTQMGLPPETYWEYAARGSEGHVYPWGNTWDPGLCQNKENLHGQERTLPAGTLPRGGSWCGALDMAGNVWEWCQDAYSPDPSAAQAAPTGRRSLRGGGWGCDEFECRCSCRLGAAPANRSPMIGLRVARPRTRKAEA
ncbi:MAG: TIR domain-containing protein [Armatimonadetes bacterium]|nr:TIR domain-containing protein [Armatimonadota bacterium]